MTRKRRFRSRHLVDWRVHVVGDKQKQRLGRHRAHVHDNFSTPHQSCLREVCYLPACPVSLAKGCYSQLLLRLQRTQLRLRGGAAAGEKRSGLVRNGAVRGGRKGAGRVLTRKERRQKAPRPRDTTGAGATAIRQVYTPQA